MNYSFDNTINRNVLISSALVTAAFIVAIFMGLVIPIFPWWLIIGIVLFPVMLVAPVLAPQIALILIMFLIFEVVPDSFQPRLPFGGGQLKLYDMMIIYLSAILMLNALSKKISIRKLMGKLWWPLVFLLLCVATSIIYAHFYTNNRIVMAEGRNFIGWLLIPLIMLAIATEKHYRLFVRGVLLIGIIIALYVSTQSIFGVRIMTAARVESLGIGEYVDVVRSIAGGGTYIMVFTLFYFINRMLDRKLPIILIAPVIMLIILGLIVSFGRGVWIATAVGILVSSFLHKGMKGVILTSLTSVIAAVLIIGIVTVAKPDTGNAITDRVLSINKEIESGGSLGWRMIENREAINNILAHPLFGVGLGGDYKKIVSSQASFAIETTYIHNGYLYFPLKMGWLAVLAPFFLIIGFILMMIDCFRMAEPCDRGFLAAVAGAFSVPVITSLTQPEWVVLQSIAAFAILMSFPLLYNKFGPLTDGN